MRAQAHISKLRQIPTLLTIAAAALAPAAPAASEPAPTHGAAAAGTVRAILAPAAEPATTRPAPWRQAETAASAIEAVAAALRQGDPAAVALAEAAADAHPDNARVLMWLGHAYRRTGKLAAASAAYRRAAAIDPDHPEILMGQAALREAVGDRLGAAALYDRVTEVAPRFAAGLRAAGESQMELGNHARAAELFGRYLELQPDNREVRYLYGISLYFGGRLDDAIATLEESVQRFPDLLSVRYALGVVLADRPESYGRALELLQQASAGGFEQTEAEYLIGRLHADQGDLEDAVAAFRRTIELDPDHLDAHYRLGTALARLGRRDEAAPVMQQFNELQQQFNATEARDKQLKTASNELAAALENNDGPAALAAVDHMLSLAPEDPDVLVAAAKVWISAGRQHDALDACEAASQLAPDHWEANYLYGLLLSHEGRPREALEPIRRSLAANPLFAPTHVIAGNVLMELSAPDSAVESYLAAIDLESDNPGYWLNLAAAYGAAGNRSLQERANAEYERLLAAQADTLPRPPRQQ